MERASSWSASQRPSGGQGRRRGAQEAPSGLLQRALSPSKVCSFSLLQDGSDSTAQDRQARRETRWLSSTTSRAPQRRWASSLGPCEKPAGCLLPPSCWRRCAGFRTSPSSRPRASVPGIEKTRSLSLPHGLAPRLLQQGHDALQVLPPQVHGLAVPRLLQRVLRLLQPVSRPLMGGRVKGLVRGRDPHLFSLFPRAAAQPLLHPGPAEKE